MAVLITDIYDSQAVAARRTQDPSNAMGFVGKAFSQIERSWVCH